MGKGSALAIAGIALVAFLVIAYVIVPSVNMPNSINLQWSVYGLKDGRQVTPPLAFIDTDGEEIDALGAECTWAAQGDNVEWDTLMIKGQFSIILFDYSGRITDITPYGLSWVEIGAQAKEGTSHFSASLESLILALPKTFSDSTGPYWDVRIELYVTGKVQQTIGSDWISDSLDDYVDYRIYWIDDTFSLTGGIIR